MKSFFAATSVRNYSVAADKPSLDGNSTTYIEEMYNSWLRDPASVHTVRNQMKFHPNQEKKSTLITKSGFQFNSQISHGMPIFVAMHIVHRHHTHQYNVIKCHCHKLHRLLVDVHWAQLLNLTIKWSMIIWLYKQLFEAIR